MARIAFYNKNLTPTTSSNDLAKYWYQSECLGTLPRKSESRGFNSAYAWSSNTLLGIGGCKYVQRSRCDTIDKATCHPSQYHGHGKCNAEGHSHCQ